MITQNSKTTSKFILNFTPTGMIPTKEMTPHVPIHPKEIIAQVTEAVSLGANMVHLHARDSQTGLPTYKKEVYAQIIAGIREKNCDVIIGVSTSGRTYTDFEQRSECLELSGDLKPDFGSLTLSSVNFNKQASINSPQMIKDLACKMKDCGIKPELEVFDLGMINYAHYLIKKGFINKPFYFNLILGNIACAQADPLCFGLMIKELPDNSIWSGGGVGDFQIKMNAMSLVAGGGVRVGLEDNIYYDQGRTRLATNRELITRVLDIGRVLGTKPYSCQEVRKILGLK